MAARRVRLPARPARAGADFGFGAPNPAAEPEKDPKEKEKEDNEEKARLEKEEADAAAAEAEAQALADFDDPDTDLWARHPKVKFRLRALLAQHYTHEPPRGVPPVSQYAVPHLFGLEPLPPDDAAATKPKAKPKPKAAAVPAPAPAAPVVDELELALAASAAAHSAASPAAAAAAAPVPAASAAPGGGDAPAPAGGPTPTPAAGEAAAVASASSSSTSAAAPSDAKDKKEAAAEAAAADEPDVPEETDVGDLVPPKFADVCFRVGPARVRIYGHRVVLAARSPVFAALLYGRFAEAKEREIAIPDLSASAFRAMLACVYGDKLVIEPTRVAECLFAAKTYQIEALRRKVVRLMMGEAGVRNACDLWEAQSGLLEEESVLMDFIEDNAAEVVQTPSFLRLSAKNVLALVQSPRLAVDEAELFGAVVKWADAELRRQKKTVSPDERKAVLKDIVPLIRFPTMTLPAFAAAVPTSGVVPPAHLLGLFQYLGDQEKEAARAASGGGSGKPQAPVGPWACGACTFYNTHGGAKCSVCRADMPPPKPDAPKPVEWKCPDCTYVNGPMRVRCEICNAKMPPPPKPDASTATAATASAADKKAAAEPAPLDPIQLKYKFPYPTQPREPRRPDVGNMRFLLWAGASRTEMQDVKSSVEAAMKEQKVRTGKHFTIDIAEPQRLLQAKELAQYDAVYVWSGSAPLPGGMGEQLAKYYESGGGLVVSAIATNAGQNQYSLSGAILQHLPYTPGQQANGTSGMRPLEHKAVSAAAVHPLLRHVKAFNGGQGSYRSQVTVARNGRALAHWTDGTPLVVEGVVNKGKRAKGGMAVLVNLYPPSSRAGGGNQYWGFGTGNDGHHLMFNALAHAGSCAQHKRAKPTGKPGGGAAAAAPNFLRFGGGGGGGGNDDDDDDGAGMALFD